MADGKKSVWIICQYAGSPYHGMNYRPYYLAKELVAKGYKVTIFTGSFSHQFYKLPETDGRFTFEEIDGIKYCWIKTPEYPESRSYGRVLSWFIFAKSLYRIKKLKLDSPKTIIVSSPSPYPIIPAKNLAKYFSAKLIFEVRDIWPLSLVELGNISPKHPFILLTQWVEDFAYRVSDKVVSLLPCADNHMVNRGMDSGKFVFIPNGVAANTNLDKPDNIPNLKAELKNRNFIIGYAGTIGLANALDTFLKAAGIIKKFKDIGFAVIGSGAELDRLKELAEELSLDNVLFVPPVNKNLVPEVLSQLDACYLGLKNEPLFQFGVSPTKLFDYMKAGKPVVMAISSCNDIVTESGCGITLEPENSDLLAEKIVELAGKSLQERQKMGFAGKEYIKNHHQWEILAAKYEEII